MILVVGATGTLGSEICRQLAARGGSVDNVIDTAAARSALAKVPPRSVREFLQQTLAG